jgi:ribosomal protein L11 methyltransferase
MRVVDYGCGSGILGIAALRLGATELLAVDNDPQALTATQDNAERNGIDAESLLIAAHDAPEPATWKGQADVVLANILAGPLEQLAPTLCDFIAPGGHLILAGLLDTQAQQLIAAYAPRLALEVIDQQEEWVCLGGQLHAQGAIA